MRKFIDRKYSIAKRCWKSGIAFILIILALTSSAFAENKKPRVLASTIAFSNLTGGEGFCPGAICTIQWQGVPSSEVVTLEYSTNGGTNWILITNTATGLSYNWTVPNTPSTNCVVRVTGKLPDEVTICSQVWMGSNLNVDHYRNGDPIPEVTDPTAWGPLTTGAWCYYNNDPANGAIYGKLYNWYAVNDSRGLAPTGWHVPSDDEWKTLEMCLGMSQAQADGWDSRGTDEGGKIKEAGTSHWYNPNTGATNSSGLSALPGGGRNTDGSFGSFGYNCHWWSSTEHLTTNAMVRYLHYYYANINRTSNSKDYGFSVRCVRD